MKSGGDRWKKKTKKKNSLCCSNACWPPHRAISDSRSSCWTVFTVSEPPNTFSMLQLIIIKLFYSMSVLKLAGPLSVHFPLCLFIRVDTHFIPLTAYLLLVTSEITLEHRHCSFQWAGVKILLVTPWSKTDKPRDSEFKAPKVKKTVTCRLNKLSKYR